MADALLHSRCTNCGALVATGWEFCGGCGRPIGDSGATDTVEIEQTTAAPRPAPSATEDNEHGDVPNNVVVLHGPPVPISPEELEAPDDSALLLVDTAAGAGEVPVTGVSTVVSGRRRPSRLVPAVVGVLLVAIAAVAITNDLGVRRSLDRTRHDLASTEAELERTAGQLGATKGELTTTTKQLDTTTAERDALKADVDAKIAELGGVRGSLNDAESRLNLQAGQIETLKSCLNGVSLALGYAARDSYTAALASLNAVEVACDKSFELF